VDIAGASIVRNRLVAQARLGYLPEGAPLYLDMSPAGFLRFMARARGLGARAASRAVEASATDCGIENVMGARIATLSKGYRRRVALASAILHDPPVLVLDEPTDGLDPNQKRVVHALVQRLSQTKAILISTHALDEVEAMCTRAVIVNRGRIVDADTPQGLKDRAPGGDLAVLFAQLTGAFEAVQA
jgi:ABC-2 type transport system ATP-binding protein